MTPRARHRMPKHGSSKRTPRAASGRCRRDEVLTLGGVGEGIEAVGEPLGDVERPPILGRQLQGQVLAEARGIRAQIQGDVEQRSPDAADQLGLREGRSLVVHAPERAALVVERHAALRELAIEAVVDELPGRPGASEVSPLIRVPLRLEQPRAGQRGGKEPQSMILVSGMGTTNLPPQLRISDICWMISSLKFQGRIST